MAQRSTKGASKQRRDAINERVSEIRELLPVSEAARSRLSQLQVMALARSYIAKSNLFVTANESGTMNEDRQTIWSDHFDFLQAVPGFLMIFNADGKIFYISDTVCDYLGNSAVDVITQTETLYELVDKRDHTIIREALGSASSDPALHSSPASSSSSSALCHPAGIVSFACRMNTAARTVRYTPSPINTSFERSRSMQVHGRRLSAAAIPGYSAAAGMAPGQMWRGGAASASDSQQHVFAAVCTPSLSAADVLSTSLLDGGAVAWDTTVFRSQHQVDMKYISVDDNGEHQLGFERGTISGKSWYEIIHPDDVDEARFKHMDLMQSAEPFAWRSMCVRVQTGRADIVWLHVVMRLCDVTDNGVTTRRVICINQLIDDHEAHAIRANVLQHDDVGSPSSLDLALLGGQGGLLQGSLLDDSGIMLSVGSKRRVAAADNWAAARSPPVKVPRQVDRMFDDANCFMSMPSPPLSLDGNFAAADFEMGCGGGYQTSGGSLLPVSCYNQLPPVSVQGPFVSVKTEPPPYDIPDAFLTPKGSPCSFTASPINHPMLAADQQEATTADLGALNELSFFDQHAVRRSSDTIKTSFINKDDKLPELDLPTVASYLDCLEHSDPLPQTTVAALPHITCLSGQQVGQSVNMDYSTAVPTMNAAGIDAAAGQQLQQQEMSTIDEEILQDLFSAARTFLGSVSAVKPFDSFYSSSSSAEFTALLAHC